MDWIGGGGGFREKGATVQGGDKLIIIIIIMFRSYIAHITSKWRLYALEALLPQL